jgi:hypothetical protein
MYLPNNFFFNLISYILALLVRFEVKAFLLQIEINVLIFFLYQPGPEILSQK